MRKRLSQISLLAFYVLLLLSTLLPAIPGESIWFPILFGVASMRRDVRLDLIVRLQRPTPDGPGGLRRTGREAHKGGQSGNGGSAWEA